MCIRRAAHTLASQVQVVTLSKQRRQRLALQDVGERSVTAIPILLARIEEPRRPPQWATRDEAPQRRVIRPHTQPVKPRLAVVAHRIMPIVEEGIVPAVAEALPDGGDAKRVVAIGGRRKCRACSLPKGHTQKLDHSGH